MKIGFFLRIDSRESPRFALRIAGPSKLRKGLVERGHVKNCQKIVKTHQKQVSTFLGSFRAVQKQKKFLSEDRDQMCSESFLRESWSWSSLFSSSAADLKGTMTICVPSVGGRGWGGRFLVTSPSFPKKSKSSKCFKKNFRHMSRIFTRHQCSLPFFEEALRLRLCRPSCDASGVAITAMSLLVLMALYQGKTKGQQLKGKIIS